MMITRDSEGHDEYLWRSRTDLFVVAAQQSVVTHADTQLPTKGVDLSAETSTHLTLLTLPAGMDAFLITQNRNGKNFAGDLPSMNITLHEM